VHAMTVISHLVTDLPNADSRYMHASVLNCPPGYIQSAFMTTGVLAQMASPQISTRFEPEIYEEILRLAKANKKRPVEIVRLLVADALARRAEELTASQFQLVENRLDYIEKRFSAWMIKIARASAKGLFYSEQIALADASRDEKKLIKDHAETSVREFMKSKGGPAAADDDLKEHS